ncbi:hypothetical protein COR50_01870 [Chitinophaga caeni]|uniref:Uncharacterized protein n=1 Tax=Chitinophaga caeni TaxID=2029983 RepID=A0A291QPU1_9BACT|nr:hypothetical protein [Chitinophaga caeni]ATL46009.1 hypothetical protein COR50_01870 [Chitinophaga caeni]
MIFLVKNNSTDIPFKNTSHVPSHQQGIKLPDAEQFGYVKYGSNEWYMQTIAQDGYKVKVNQFKIREPIILLPDNAASCHALVYIEAGKFAVRIPRCEEAIVHVKTGEFREASLPASGIELQFNAGYYCIKHIELTETGIPGQELKNMMKILADIPVKVLG